jgi:hypothetical protein
MIGKKIKEVVKHLGAWRTIQAALAGCIVALLIVIVLQVTIPINLREDDSQAHVFSELNAPGNLSQSLRTGGESLPSEKIDAVYRPGLFRASTGLQDKPLADKTIERIKSQLKLQCIMEMNGQLVAYININGLGLKKCYIGNSINDLFTVLDINNQSKSVDISIVDHKVTLHL